MSEYPYEQPPADRTLKIPHLVFGLLFLGFAGLWALGESGAISGEGVTILGPAVLVLAGVVGLAASLAAGRNRHRRERDSYTQPVDPAVSAEVDPEVDSGVDDTIQYEENQS